MASSVGKISFTLLAAAFLASGSEDVRPACNAENLGRMWPEEANRDPKLFGKLMRCGQLKMCTRGAWRYRWDSPSISVEQLRRGASAVPAYCEALPESKAAVRAQGAVSKVK